jgi:peptide/nickel transport system substrate-binding protein
MARASNLTARIKAWSVAAAALALALGGCTGGEPEGSASPTDSSGLTTTIRIGLAGLSDADALDPAEATTTGGYVIAKQLFDTLTEYGQDGSWQPRLAQSVTPGATADQWTVTLRPATWHDGRPVTADDVVASFARWFDNDLPPAGSLPFIDPDGIEAVDDSTVAFHLRYPTVVFPEALTSPLMAIVPQDFNPAEPIGSGPFTLASNSPGIRLTFTANPDYWGDGPYVDSLEIIGYADGVSEANALSTGQIDIAGNVDPALVDVIRAQSPEAEIYSYPTSGALTWAMNVQQEPFQEAAVRQALRLGVDRQQIVDQVYNGYARIGNDYFSPFDALYSDGIPQREYDPEGAKAILEAAGYTLPVHVELTGAPNQPTSDRQNEIIVQQAAAAGFDIKFNKVDMATFYGDAYGTYPLSLSYWGFAGIFDQAAMTIIKDAPWNGTKWNDAEYDDLYVEAVQAVDQATRQSLVTEMQTIEYDRGPYIVPIFLDSLVAHAPNVTGFVPYPNTDGPLGYNFNLLRLTD